MTEIAFHFNVPDRLGYACRLLRKAWRGGAEVAVVGQPALLDRLDQLLWTFDPLAFIPHVRLRPGGPVRPALQAHTTIWLVERGEAAPHRAVLVNLGDEVPPGFEGFNRLIDVVSVDAAERQAGRARWKHYADRGYVIERHEVGA
jgi:DNA polymerase-3 subunit chi